MYEYDMLCPYILNELRILPVIDVRSERDFLDRTSTRDIAAFE
jgi:hypothetical protein